MDYNEKLVQLGRLIERFAILYNGELNPRCVDVSSLFANYATQYGFEVNCVTKYVQAKGFKQEHSWNEIKLGNIWYVLDFTGKYQFKLGAIMYRRSKYLPMLIKQLNKGFE